MFFVIANMQWCFFSATPSDSIDYFQFEFIQPLVLLQNLLISKIVDRHEIRDCNCSSLF